MTRTCSECGIPKPLADFERTENWRRHRCKKCRQKEARIKRASDPEYRNRANAAVMKKYRENPTRKLAIDRKSKLKLCYGITPDQFNFLARSGCSICEKHKKLCCDHDHATGQFRGLLCRNCNACLGWLEANPGEAIADYLKYSALITQHLLKSNSKVFPPPATDPK